MITNREEVIDKAFKVFLRMNYEKASISTLAKACGVVKTGVVYYFPHKLDLFMAVADKYAIQMQTPANKFAEPAGTLAEFINQYVEGVKTAVAVFDSRTDKKDADFVEERRIRTAQTKEDTAQAILNVLAESRLGSMASSELRAAVVKEIGCSEGTYNRAYGELVKSGKVTKHIIRQRDGRNKWYSSLYCSETSDKVQI